MRVSIFNRALFKKFFSENFQCSNNGGLNNRWSDIQTRKKYCIYPLNFNLFPFLDKGEYVDLDEIIAIIETEKVKVDIRSGMAGTLSNLFANEGDTVAVGKPLYEIDDAGKKPEAKAQPEVKAAEEKLKAAAAKPTPPPVQETKPKPAAKAQPVVEKSTVLLKQIINKN